jgi:hypothetical protein
VWLIDRVFAIGNRQYFDKKRNNKSTKKITKMMQMFLLEYKLALDLSHPSLNLQIFKPEPSNPKKK